MSVYIFLIILFIIIFGVFLLVIKYSKKNKLSLLVSKELLNRLFIIIRSRGSSKEKLIDLDKLYHYILKQMGYGGTFGEILKLNPREIGNINKIWELHKLRNKLVHDFDIISEASLKKKVLEYQREIKVLLK